MNNFFVGWWLEVGVKYVVAKKQNLLCFVSLYFPRPLVMMAYNKANIQCLFLFNIEIIHPW